MEKIKDILYELSDILFSLFVIALVAGIIALTSRDLLAKTQQTQHHAVVAEESSSRNTEVTEEVSESAEAPATEPAVSKQLENIGQERSIILTPGLTTDEVARMLVEQGLILDAPEFIFRYNQLNPEHPYLEGEHQIIIGTSIDDIILLLYRAPVQ